MKPLQDMNPLRKRFLLPVALLVCLALPGLAQAKDLEAPAQAKKKTAAPADVDLVLCLDTSGSMSGLIHAAREKLWSVVTELAAAKPTPRLRVALLTFGSPGHADRGHVILQTGLTEDLDLVSEKLFALGTNGGDEYVGRVMHYALEDLGWSKGGLRVLFVAGNESADQDKVQRYTDVAKRAVNMGIKVNPIYCGGADDADAASWRQLAVVGEGRFANIDHNHGTVRIATPYDKELAQLSARVNKTYLFFGAQRADARDRMTAQDANAENAGAPAAAERAAAKASGLYKKNDDLVARLAEGTVKLEEIEEKDLPEALKKLEPAKRAAFVADKQKEREALVKQIQELTRKRSDYIQAEMKKRSLDDKLALDRVLKDTIREQAGAAGFKFKQQAR